MIAIENELIEKAQNGDRKALEEVVRLVQDPIYHLAMRILINPEDAREASQEIMILIITQLSTFRFESKFTSWAYRVATNYLFKAKKLIARQPALTFDHFREDLESGLDMDAAAGSEPASASASAEHIVLLNELRLSCTMAMLLCLDMNHRLAYVLGDILEFDHNEAAGILEISKDNFRKRLSRARGEVKQFTLSTCGLANEKARCSCPRRLPTAMELGRVTPHRISYHQEGAPAYHDVVSKVQQVEQDLKTLTLQRAVPHYKNPEDLRSTLARIVGGPMP